MTRTHPPSPEDVYDATIAVGWHMATCLHRDRSQAEQALEQAYAALSRDWPRDLSEGRRRLLELLCAQAGHRTGASPAA